jgi:peroxiredoxin
VLAAVFLVAAIAKFRDRAGARKTAIDVGVPGALADGVAFLLPIAELACAVALLPVATAWWGAAGLLTLLIAFSVVMAIAMARGRSVDCRCFGQLKSTPIGPATLARNVVLATMAAAVVLSGPSAVGGSVVASVAGLHGGQMLNLVLGLIIISGVFALTQVLKQYGTLLLRVEALENRIAGGAAAAPPGLQVGSPAPTFSLKGLDGKTVTLEALTARAKKLLLVFVAPACPACDQLLVDLAGWQREHKGQLAIALVGRDAAKTRAKVARHGLDTVLIQSDREVEEQFGIEMTPSAVLLRDGFVASSVAVGGDAIESLVVDATMPPPVTRGDLVPSARVPMLGAESMDLATLPGRALILFWNPACGFCQEMLEDVRQWERDGRNDGIELVVASSGSVAEVRAQGFTSPVILDRSSSVMRLFGGTATPSAVLVEDGRVTSNVEVGAAGVWKLAGLRQAVPA